MFKHLLELHCIKFKRGEKVFLFWEEIPITTINFKITCSLVVVQILWQKTSEFSEVNKRQSECQTQNDKDM